MKCLLHPLPCRHLPNPLLHQREIICIVLLLWQNMPNHSLPHDECDVCVGELVAYEPGTGEVGAVGELGFLR